MSARGAPCAAQLMRRARLVFRALSPVTNCIKVIHGTKALNRINGKVMNSSIQEPRDLKGLDSLRVEKLRPAERINSNTLEAVKERSHH